MLEHALQYLADGWSIIPVGKDKKPLIQWKEYQSRKPTQEEVTLWWKQWPKANIGAVTGKVSGVVVIDIDSSEGQHNIESLLGDQLNGIPHVETGGGGKHYYFAHPGGDSISNAVSLLPGVDFRADGGYVVVPPSVHSSGKPYEWVNIDKPIDKKLPSGVLNITKTKSEMDWTSDISEGQRDTELTRKVGKLVQLNMTENDIIPMMVAWSSNHCKPPLATEQIVKIVRSIIGREYSKNPPPIKDPKKFKVSNFMDTLNSHGLVETSWSITDWLPSNTIGMMVAPPGSYKTWLLMHMAHCVSTGQKLFGLYEVQDPGPVIIVQQEDPFPLLMSRSCVMMNIGEVKEKDGVFSVPTPPTPPDIYWHTTEC